MWRWPTLYIYGAAAVWRQLALFSCLWLYVRRTVTHLICTFALGHCLFVFLWTKLWHAHTHCVLWRGVTRVTMRSGSNLENTVSHHKSTTIAPHDHTDDTTRTIPRALLLVARMPSVILYSLRVRFFFGQRHDFVRLKHKDAQWWYVCDLGTGLRIFLPLYSENVYMCATF